MNKIWKNQTETISAESIVAVRQQLCEFLGHTLEELQSYGDFEAEPLPDDALLSITFRDGYQEKDGNGDTWDIAHPTWVDRAIRNGVPNVKVERVVINRQTVSRVTAPAKVWAQHETGIIGSTEV